MPTNFNTWPNLASRPPASSLPGWRTAMRLGMALWRRRPTALRRWPRSCSPRSNVTTRRPRRRVAQESVYSGYKKMHGHKMETVFFPNRIITCFGPVSARQNDRGTLNISGLDCFLVLIQAHLPPQMQCMVFGDSVYRGITLQMITSYHRALLPDVLTPSKLKCNSSLRAARMPIEKN